MLCNDQIRITGKSIILDIPDMFLQVISGTASLLNHCNSTTQSDLSIETYLIFIICGWFSFYFSFFFVKKKIMLFNIALLLLNDLRPKYFQFYFFSRYYNELTQASVEFSKCTGFYYPHNWSLYQVGGSIILLHSTCFASLNTQGMVMHISRYM